MPARRRLLHMVVIGVAVALATCLVFAAWIGFSLLGAYALFELDSPRLARTCGTAVRVLLWPGRALNPGGWLGGPGATCLLFSLFWGAFLVAVICIAARLLHRCGRNAQRSESKAAGTDL
ncbi:MAG: hypothetical protein GXP31_07715 [Kiritimatiellaeota bacterium]|nr:hypothetical protein [Kiritimatiellota bacterium]